MKNILLLLFLSFTTAACENCDPGEVVGPACSVENPVEELAWLRDEIQARLQQPTSEYTQYEYIAQTEYRGETVFVYGNCCPNCNTIFSVFNCSGEQISQLGYREEDIDFGILEQAVMIWKPEDYSCTL